MSDVAQGSFRQAKDYVDNAIASFAFDPPDNQFLKGYLSALEVIQAEAFTAAQPPAAPVENKKGDQIHWLKVNDEPFEYAIQQGPHGDEFVKLLNGECLRRPLCRSSAGTGDGGVRAALALRLRDAAQTAQNDDLSKPDTEKRQRHVIRVEAMLDAAEYLEEVMPAVPQTVRETDTYRDTVRKVAAVREKSLADAVEKNAAFKKALEEINSQAVCAYMADPDECRQMLQNCAEISDGALSLSRPQSRSGE
jgi:hypothetical protein